MNLVISGLTAAGKTTHAKLLAKHLNYDYVSASRVLAQLAGVDVDPEAHWWLRSGGRISEIRSEAGLDRRLDELMVAKASEARNQVFDAWALPWTSRASMLRVWLSSDPPSRYRKCKVSHAQERELTLAECKAIVDRKDDESRRIFRDLHGFDLFNDTDVFDVVVDLSGLIPEPTEHCALQGIAKADAFLRQVVLCALGREDASQRDLKRAQEAMPSGSVLKLPW